MKKQFSLMAIFLILTTLLSYGQSNEMIDKLLDSSEATFAESALLILQSAEIIDLYGTPDDAIKYLTENSWFRRLKEPDDLITLGDVSLLLMRAFEIKGGLSWNIYHSPRYAARELQFIGAFYKQDNSPYRKISGEEIINLIGWIMDFQNGEESAIIEDESEGENENS